MTALQERPGLVIALIALGALVSVPFWAGRADMRTLIEIAYFLALAQMWNLLAGYAGLVSVGQQAYVGLGGYMLFVLAAFANVHPLVAVPLAGVIAAVVAMPTAHVVFRLRGAYFAIGTWVVAEAFRLLFAQLSVLGGGSGMSLPVAAVRAIAPSRSGREMMIYFVALALAAGAIALVYWLLRSRHGLALTAIRDSETASASLGVDVARTKYWVYVLVAFWTGMIGALIYLQILRISPDAAFSVIDWTAFVIFMVVIGGIGTIAGPVVGVLLFFALREALEGYATLYLILLGATAVVIMLRAPQGLWGLAEERLGLRLFRVERRAPPRPDDTR